MRVGEFSNLRRSLEDILVCGFWREYVAFGSHCGVVWERCCYYFVVWKAVDEFAYVELGTYLVDEILERNECLVSVCNYCSQVLDLY
jgi:hypothetical protein